MIELHLYTGEEIYLNINLISSIYKPIEKTFLNTGEKTCIQMSCGHTWKVTESISDVLKEYYKQRR